MAEFRKITKFEGKNTIFNEQPVCPGAQGRPGAGHALEPGLLLLHALPLQPLRRDPLPHPGPGHEVPSSKVIIPI